MKCFPMIVLKGEISNLKHFVSWWPRITCLLDSSLFGCVDYADNGEYWRSWYESATFRADCEELWMELKPLYTELHSYVLRKLKEKFPKGTFPASGHIPAHLLGELIIFTIKFFFLIMHGITCMSYQHYGFIMFGVFSYITHVCLYFTVCHLCVVRYSIQYICIVAASYGAVNF